MTTNNSHSECTLFDSQLFFLRLFILISAYKQMEGCCIWM